MGSGGLELENQNLNRQIEGELKPEINKLKNEIKNQIKKEEELKKDLTILKKEKANYIEKEKEFKKEKSKLNSEYEIAKKNTIKLEDKTKFLEKELENQKNINEKNKIDLTPQEIQEIMEDNGKMKNEIFSLETKIKNLEETEKNLKLELTKYMQYNTTLFSENNQLKMSNSQLFQLIQNQNPNMNYNNLNLNNQQNYFMDTSAFTNLNNINNNNFNNMNINNNINDNNNANVNIINNNNELKKIIFKLENDLEYETVAADRFKLKEIYSTVLPRINNNEYSDLTTLKFLYKNKDVSSYFLNNEPVKNLNLEKSNCIEVIKSKELRSNESTIILQKK